MAITTNAPARPLVIETMPATSGRFPLPAGPVARTVLFMLAGAMPVSSIPLYVLGWLTMSTAALCLVLPLTIATMALVVAGSTEAAWAVRGILAGLVAVFSYDLVRMPLVWTHVWPDFIPRIGGWVLGDDRPNAVIGYTWRYLGDGAGIGMAYFVFCAAVLSVRPALIVARPVMCSIGYGVCVWSGLIATVVLPARGEQLLFRLTPASFALSLVGHLIYGSVLGLALRRHVGRHRTSDYSQPCGR